MLARFSQVHQEINLLTKQCYCNADIHYAHYFHYANMPVLYTEFSYVVKIKNFDQKIFDIFLIFAQNIDCGYTLEPPRLTLCFGAKIRKIGIPLHTPVLLYKSGVQGGIHCTDMFS